MLSLNAGDHLPPRERPFVPDPELLPPLLPPELREGVYEGLEVDEPLLPDDQERLLLPLLPGLDHVELLPLDEPELPLEYVEVREGELCWEVR